MKLTSKIGIFALSMQLSYGNASGQQLYTLNGERFSFEKAKTFLNWKSPDRIAVYDANGRKKEIIEDYNENGIIGDVGCSTSNPLGRLVQNCDRYIQIMQDGRQRVFELNRFVDENGNVYRYQGPSYHASDEEQRVIEVAREKLKEITIKYQKFKKRAYEETMKKVR